MKYKFVTFFVIGLSLIVQLTACSGSDKSPAGVQYDPQPYFSLAEFFNSEIERLELDSAEILKTVEINGSVESKSVRIENWKNEFAPFIDADINKSAWVNSYAVESTDSTTSYISKEPNLKTKHIHIKFGEDGSPVSIAIENQVENWIYTAREKLTYYPDSYYEIFKEQDIRIVGHNQYRIRGEWKTPLAAAAAMAVDHQNKAYNR